MLRNLILIALRNIRKEKAYSLLNITGLTVGITCSLFLMLYIFDEISYDRYHTQAENIYRIVSNIKEPDNAFTWAVAQVPLADELRDNYPEVKNVVRFIQMSPNTYKREDKELPNEDFYMADSTVFDMFTYPFVAGDPNTALDLPFSIVLTESIAKKYFANVTEGIGQTLTNQQGELFKITGVMKDVPLNSHFRFNALISRNTRPQFTGSWGGFGVYTYIQLPPGYDLTKMDASLEKVVKEKVNPVFEQVGIKVQYELQRITDIHLKSKIQDEAEAGGDMSYIYIFSAVAIFMLVIACINYMNLATARSANRAKEVGIRKVMGSQRQQLVFQFVTESVVMTLIAVTISLALVFVLLPSFNLLANKALQFSSLLQTQVLLGLGLIVLITGLAGGSYPAFYLSGFNPVNVLKGKLAARGGNVWLRKSLVVVQFTLSIFMLISTLVVFDQLKFLRNKDLGFDKQQVVRLDVSSRNRQQSASVLMDKLRQSAAVERVGQGDSSPGQGVGKLLFQVEDNEGKLVDRGVDVFGVDQDFVTALGMKVVKGRDFSRDVASDTIAAVIVNEAMVKRMAWDEPLGKRFVLGTQQGPQERKVVGVIQDYHQNSLYDAIEPIMILIGQQFNYAFVKTKGGDIRQSLAAVEKIWKEVYPNEPFDYQFLDEDFNSQYQGDEKRSRIFTLFSGLTIFIACLGLLGLAAFTTEQRTKEIGVRKVIGASVGGLVRLVSKEYFALVAIGLVLAIPLAWYFTENWLQNFAYRIDMKGEWPMLLVSAAMAFVVTALTVGFHVVKAAMSNPVKSLRTE
ncbi:MAG: ABC transporter permease [Cyclobacteriaceae bacterium]|nr:ABC transporter permease [Cyclobacteriaceae bacterium]